MPPDLADVSVSAATNSVDIRPDGEVEGRTRAMATGISVRAHGASTAALLAAMGAALEVFHEVERECTRFDPESPLMRANAAGDRWAVVPKRCFAAIRAAAEAYHRTGGRFDPRVLGDLVQLGYAGTRAFDSPTEVPAPFPAGGTPAALDPGRDPLPAWNPQFRHDVRAVRIGPHPIDLGGIGKGLAATWAADVLADQLAVHSFGGGYLVEAGGDCYAAGCAADGGPWRVGVEDPFYAAAQPLAVLEVRDRAVATSSIRLRRWRAGERQVHHLIDPRTGLPGGEGLVAVTVVGADGDDVAGAEVDAKTLFLAGAKRIAAGADRAGIAACWVGEDATLTTSAAFESYIAWRRL